MAALGLDKSHTNPESSALEDQVASLAYFLLDHFLKSQYVDFDVFCTVRPAFGMKCSRENLRSSRRFVLPSTCRNMVVTTQITGVSDTPFRDGLLVPQIKHNSWF